MKTKTPEELKQLAKEVSKSKEQQRKDREITYKEQERERKTRARERAEKDVDRAILLLEKLVSKGKTHEHKNGHKFYVIENYSDSGEINEWFYEDLSKEYWEHLTNLMKKRGFKAVLGKTTNDVYDSMSTYDTYEIWITL